MTKRLLASELGVTSETLSRTLAKFRNHQLVRVEGRSVTLTCPERLAASVRSNLDLPPVSATTRPWNRARRRAHVARIRWLRLPERTRSRRTDGIEELALGSSQLWRTLSMNTPAMGEVRALFAPRRVE
jgi:hypothetical protein